MVVIAADYISNSFIEFKDDKKHGKGYYINPNGMNYDGGYKNDMFHGKGKFVDATGKVIEGTFKEGKLIK